MNAGISYRICRGRGCTDGLKSPQRTGLNDCAATALLHRLRGCLCHEEFALQNRVEEAIILRFGDLGERYWLEDPSIVNEDVQPTKLFFGKINESSSGCGLADISSEDADHAGVFR